ncbi:MAG: hypothetical protein ABA06_04845 [Parcubacteria bacterium C7867-001]|nr:MAG: hypothetical protein ABA06_04845 [Parcubacteria bacterium C7867-001]
MLYTRRGDDGTSGLFGTKNRFPKDSLAFEALGTLDELNSFIGVCRAHACTKNMPVPLINDLLNMQECLFIIQAELAGSGKSLEPAHLMSLERTTDEYENHIDNPHAFIISGATEFSALLDYARAVSRRAERAVVRAGSVQPLTHAYLNRLSSALYALARYASTRDGAKELSPSY